MRNLFSDATISPSAVVLFVPSVVSCHETVVLFVSTSHAAVVQFVSFVASRHKVVVPLYGLSNFVR